MLSVTICQKYSMVALCDTGAKSEKVWSQHPQLLEAKNLEVGDNNSKGAMTKLQPWEPTVIGSIYQVGLTIKGFFSFQIRSKEQKSKLLILIKVWEKDTNIVQNTLKGVGLLCQLPSSSNCELPNTTGWWNLFPLAFMIQDIVPCK